MGRLFLLLFFIFWSVNLSAYSKKIIMASFTTKERAQTMVNSLSTENSSLYKLSKEHKFAFNIRKSGKYYMLVAEIFTDKKVLKTSLKKIKKRFKGAYSNNYNPPKVSQTTEVKKVKKNVEVEKKVKKVKSIDKNITKKTPIPVLEKKVKIEEVQEPKLEEKTQNIVNVNGLIDAFNKYFQWSYIVMLILAGVILNYYIKFKKIYDEY